RVRLSYNSLLEEALDICLRWHELRDAPVVVCNNRCIVDHFHARDRGRISLRRWSDDRRGRSRAVVETPLAERDVHAEARADLEQQRDEDRQCGLNILHGKRRIENASKLRQDGSLWIGLGYHSVRVDCSELSLDFNYANLE